MAEFGPEAGKKSSRKGLLDTRLYLQQLKAKYPDVAYWVSWSSWDNGNGTHEYQALIHNQYVNNLFESPDVITREKIGWKFFIQPIINNVLFTRKIK